MSQVAQEVVSESTVPAAPMSMFGFSEVSFTFSRSETSTKTQTISLANIPQGAQTATIAVQAFNGQYSGSNHFDFGQLEIAMAVEWSKQSAKCEMSLRDNHQNKREWEGSAVGLVTYFGLVT
jgi:hypothetical protein